MRRYLLFARVFKPKICKSSADYMVEEYKRLRQRDSSGVCVCVCCHGHCNVVCVTRSDPVIMAHHCASTGEHDPSF